MLLAHTNDPHQDEQIIELLHEKESTGPTLLANLKLKNSHATKETFYRTLRKLVSNEVIARRGKTYQLNRHWLQKIYRFSRKHIETNQGMDADNILSFREGDKIVYRFKNPNLMGIYWAHTYDMIFEQHDKRIPILIYHPHEWLVHTRTESESFFLSRFHEDQKPAFFAIGGKTTLDATFKRTYENRFVQIGIGITYGLKNTDYINVIGDFIFTISVSKKFAHNIDAFFRANNTVTTENINELKKLCNRSDKVKMVFTRSKKEAAKWHTKWNKDFYIPRQ